MRSSLQSTALFLLDQGKIELLKPFKKRRWRNAGAPFQHVGVKGLTFELKPGEFVDYVIYTEGAYEKRFLQLVEALLPQRRTALDIGANIGNHALFFSHAFSSVHAFEPNPEIIARLHLNISANNASNISVHEFGLSEENASLPFHHNGNGNAGMGKFLETDEAGATKLEVRRGDEVINEQRINDIDFIKIDVEGHEISALKGLRNTIETQQPIIAFEFHAADYPQGYFDEFRTALPNYRFYDCLYKTTGSIGEQIIWQLKSAGYPRLKEITFIDKETYKNIIATPARFDCQHLEPFME